MKAVLITGGAGFIGSHTVDYLLQQQIQVTVYDNFSSGNLKNLPKAHPLLKIVNADILDQDKLQAAISGVDAVLHLAAIVSVPVSIEEPLKAYQVNSTGFMHVLDLIRQAPKRPRLVYASSSSVYGDSALLPCPDDQSLSGAVLSPYALHKLQMEQVAALYARLYGIESLGLRYFNVYGSRQDPSSPYSGVISRFMKLYAQDQTLTIFGDGEQSRDFIHVSDVARANYLALASKSSGVLNIATGQAQTLKQLLSYLEAHGGRKAKQQFSSARAGDIRESYAKTQKAREKLAFESTLSLQEGIRDLLKEQAAEEAN